MGATNHAVNTDDSSLDNLLAELNLIDDEIVLQADEEEVVAEVKIEAVSDEAVEEVIAEPVAKAEKAKAPKAPKEAKPKAEKKAVVPRKSYATKVERLTDHLGDKLGEYMVLEVADAGLEGDALKIKQAETLASIGTSGKKVQNRITFILEFMAGQSAKLNGVIATAVKLLRDEGQIVTGVEGNLYKALVAHPYSDGAAKAMGGNTVLALQKLKVVTQGSKGQWVANPNSLVLAKLLSMGVGA
jgi:hypothetical protein